MALEGPLLVRWHFMDMSPTSSSAGVTWTATGWQVTPSRHTREMPRAMQVDPISLIKPQAKMTHAGIQDDAGGPTSILVGSRDPPSLRVRWESRDPPPLPDPRVSGDPQILFRRVSRYPPQGGK